MTDATLRGYDGWVTSLRNFDVFKSVLPGASDIDLCAHADGPGGDKFLILESKRFGERLSVGQRRLLDALRAEANKTVVVVYGPDPDGNYFLTGAWTGTATLQGLLDRVGAWWQLHKFGIPNDRDEAA